jgi:hypothetical protein
VYAACREEDAQASFVTEVIAALTLRVNDAPTRPREPRSRPKRKPKGRG